MWEPGIFPGCPRVDFPNIEIRGFAVIVALRDISSRCHQQVCQ